MTMRSIMVVCLLTLMSLAAACSRVGQSDCDTEIAQSICIAKNAPFTARANSADGKYFVNITLGWSEEQMSFGANSTQDVPCRIEDGTIYSVVGNGVVMTTPKSLNEDDMRYAYAAVSDPNDNWIFAECDFSGYPSVPTPPYAPDN